MKVIISFGEKKVVVPCGMDGEISIRELINLATAKYSKLSYQNGSILNSDQVQLRLNNGAVVDPDDRVCDVVDDREELFAIIDSHHHHQSIHPSYTTTINSNGELSSSVTSSNLSSSLSEHERLMVPSSTNRHEVIVTDADLRTRSLRVKNDPNIQSHHQMTHRQTYSPPTQDATKISFSNDLPGMYDVYMDEKTSEKIFSIILPKENTPLGIHVIPYNEDEQQVNGLLMQNIEPDGRIKRQGILQINDRIIEINRTNIERCSFDKAQLIFRTALLEPELELRVARPTTTARSNPKLHTAKSEINHIHEFTFTDQDANMNSLNTRRLGKIIKISLVKGNDGLGFKLASRDNPTGVANPIYVKTIFPKGAAIEDGRLQRGDRLLSVNSIDVTRMPLQETVGLLRDTRVGETVELCISRQRDGSTSQELMDDGVQTIDRPTNEIQPQIMTFDIPLNDTSSAGLGITLKGKTSIVEGQSIDLGIFVKSILTGGAASRDNRLRPNDQLLVINDSILMNLSNLEAAAILHESVRREIHPGHIKVTISRLPISAEEHSRHVKETDLSPSLLASNPVNNDENELDLTTFVPPPLARKPPSQQQPNRHSHSEMRSASLSGIRSTKNSSPPERHHSEDLDRDCKNPFDRETSFRQSMSEKRRLTHQPNKQVIQWKQRSFHDSRPQTERKFHMLSTATSIDILTPVIDLSDDDDDDDINETDIECRYSVTRRSEIPMRALPDNNNKNNNNHPLSPGLGRSSSFESIHLTNEEPQSSNALPVNEEERKRQAKLRSRACNDSFRQAVDKSYEQNPNLYDDEMTISKGEKQRFRFSNLFTTKSKRKENQEDNRTIKSIYTPIPQDARPAFYPPPPPAFTSRPEPPSLKPPNNDRPSNSFSYSSAMNEQQQGYQPYRFDTSKTDHLIPTRFESQLVHTFQPKSLSSGKSSLSINHSKPSHHPIPRQFYHANINGSQSLKQQHSSSHPSILPTSTRSPYPSTFTVQPAHFTSYSHNFDNPINSSQQQQQQTRRIGYTTTPIYPTSRSYFPLENPANV